MGEFSCGGFKTRAEAVVLKSRDGIAETLQEEYYRATESVEGH